MEDAPDATPPGDGADVMVAPPGPENLDAATPFLSAFCDAAWPVTKGNSSAYVCGSRDECIEAGAGAPETCYGTIAPSDCSGQRWATWCVAGEWKCATGAVHYQDCKCWDVDGGCP